VGLSRDPDGAASRLPGAEWHGWPEPAATEPPEGALAGADGIIHLLGEPLDQRWRPPVKQRLHDSRVLATRNLVTVLRRLPEDRRPPVLISQSATGYYGPRGSEPIDEHGPVGEDFLARLVSSWEQEALAASALCRVVVTRTGVVLAPHGGALAKMLPFFRAGVGGPVAGGRQYFPWVHIDDLVAALLFCLDNGGVEGPVNVTSPQGADNAALARALGRVLRRPAVLPVPAAALKLLYGEMAVIVITGQRAVPQRLEQLGFGFSHPELESALRDVLS
ncbi:MAG: TIGR01777 family oxidoreductase, partial [Acidobacteriota bacterium]|nr:TIGR01777 family oxidoreductase [Acidobacteriota bacterium]